MKQVKDLMLPLKEYAVVDEDATLHDAVVALDLAQPENRQPHRAVLAVDKQGKVVGKLGHLAFLKALEPGYNDLGDLGILARAGVSPSFIDSMMHNLNVWHEDLPTLYNRAREIRVKDVMHPVKESVEEDAPLSEGIHKLILWQTLSLLVTRKGEVTGVLRLSDVYDEIAGYIRKKKSGRWTREE